MTRQEFEQVRYFAVYGAVIAMEAIRWRDAGHTVSMEDMDRFKLEAVAIADMEHESTLREVDDGAA